MANKFKTGDMAYHKRHERIYEILSDKGNKMFPYTIQSESGHKFGTSDSYLEEIKIADTKITRKLYPHYTPDGKGNLVWRS